MQLTLNDGKKFNVLQQCTNTHEMRKYADVDQMVKGIVLQNFKGRQYLVKN